VMMKYTDVQAILKDITVLGDLFHDLQWETRENSDPAGTFIQVRYMEPDVDDLDGPPQPQLGRMWFIPTHASEDDVIRTAHKALRTSLEHRLGEFFRLEGRAVYSPHRSLYRRGS
jgi:hypothetical protein